jgi:hypothetical protein
MSMLILLRSGRRIVQQFPLLDARLDRSWLEYWCHCFSGIGWIGRDVLCCATENAGWFGEQELSFGTDLVMLCLLLSFGNYSSFFHRRAREVICLVLIFLLVGV